MSSKTEKPTLTGQRIRSRKRDDKVKFDPPLFRDQLVAGLIEAGDLESASKWLDQAGTSQTSRGHTIQKADSLDYRRYSDTLFDVFLTGGILAPGGNIVDDDAPLNPLSVFATDGSDAAIKAVAEFVRALIRRYKYLQVLLEDEMAKVLMFLKAFDGVQQKKLAKAMGIFIAFGLCSPKPLGSLMLDSLRQEGLSGTFLLHCLKAWSNEASIQGMSSGMRKTGLDSEVLNFFPPNRQTIEHFRETCAELGDMEDILVWQLAQQVSSIKRGLQARVIELVGSDEDDGEPDNIISEIKEVMEANNLKELDTINLIWSGIMGAIEWNMKIDQLASQSLHHIKRYHSVLKAFCSTHKAQVQLMVRMQNYCYDNQQFLKIYNRICLFLYKAEVVGEDAILEWYTRSHSPKGKTVFLAQMKQMVEWLQSAEEDSSSGEEESDED